MENVHVNIALTLTPAELSYLYRTVVMQFDMPPPAELTQKIFNIRMALRAPILTLDLETEPDGKVLKEAIGSGRVPSELAQRKRAKRRAH